MDRRNGGEPNRKYEEYKYLYRESAYEKEMLIGMIWGQKEQYYDGMHFQIQEFCVKPDNQGSGYGTLLLDALRKALEIEKITTPYFKLSLTSERMVTIMTSERLLTKNKKGD